MSQLDNIVTVTVDRQTQAVAQASFGIPGIMAEFATNKTTTTFTRAREYDSLSELLDDGWTTSDTVYKKASAMFRQNPTVKKIVVGRKDSTDADWAAALNAIQAENDSWYRFVVCPVTPATPNTELEAVAAWTETQKKRFFAQVTDTGVLASGTTTDLGSVLKALGYDRTTLIYHTAANSDEYAESSWLGEGAPFDPGSSTEAYKTLKGVTADKLTSAQKSVAQGKRVNTYTTVGGVAITEKGIACSGEFGDVIEGIDWLESRLQETIFGTLVNTRKIAFDDGGIQMIRGLVKGAGDEAGRKGILQGDTIVVTALKYSEIPQSDRLARHLPDITLSALLQGAIHTTAIQVVVSV